MFHDLEGDKPFLERPKEAKVSMQSEDDDTDKVRSSSSVVGVGL